MKKKERNFVADKEVDLPDGQDDKAQDGDTPESKEGADGEAPESKEGADGDTPESKEGADGDTPESKEGADGDTPESKEGADGDTPKSKEGADGETQERKEDADSESRGPLDVPMFLTAMYPILYLSHQYKVGDILPANDFRMVAAWISAGTAVWRSAPEKTAKVKPRTAEPGLHGQAVCSEAQDGDDLVGKIPRTIGRKR